MTSTLLLFAAQKAVPQKAIALTIFLGALLVWVLFLITENRRTTKTNVQSFLSAPNRKLAPDDENFEGPRLDRFLGWALIGITIMAVSLPLYWLGERGRQEGAINGFDKRSVKRGSTNYLNAFQCGNCHGASGAGGVAAFTVAQYNPDGTPKMNAVTGKQELKSVSWKAPRINDVALRYKEDQIRNVLIYGRGSNKPMPAWGLKGGGPANEQQIDDLVNFLKHWAIEKNEKALNLYKDEWSTNGNNSDKAYEVALAAAKDAQQAETTTVLAESKVDAQKNIDRLKAVEAEPGSYQAAVDKAQKAYDGKKDGDDKEAKNAAKANLDAAKKILSDYNLSVEALTRANDAAAKGTDAGLKVAAQRKLDAATKALADAQAHLKKSDGQILFESQCARCHTNGWSYDDPKEAGGGFYGKRLSKESLLRQFPEAATQAEFIKQGADEGKSYGAGGVGNYAGGGMPYFANLLTDKQIEQIVSYERGL